MKKTLVSAGGAILLALFCVTAAAEWVQWSADRNAKINFYYDPASVGRTGEVARMSILFDFQNPVKEGGVAYSSLVEQGEYRCQSRQRRVMKATWHAGRMGAGAGTVSSKGPAPWVEVSEDLERRAWDLACRKKR